MKVVVGLGNPGQRYAGTRHNVGFEVLDVLAERYGSPKAVSKFDAQLIELSVAGEKTLLVAPQTFMNLSGKSVGRYVSFFQLPLDDLLVVCDDLNLPLGKLRLRPQGSAGGQKGLADIIRHLGSEEFSRLRIGIDRPPENVDAADYVLTRFSRAEREVIDGAVSSAADGVERWIGEGLDAAMNRVNAPGGVGD